MADEITLTLEDRVDLMFSMVAGGMPFDEVPDDLKRPVSVRIHAMAVQQRRFPLKKVPPAIRDEVRFALRRAQEVTQ